jgi:hypothetical protein
VTIAPPMFPLTFALFYVLESRRPGVDLSSAAARLVRHRRPERIEAILGPLFAGARVIVAVEKCSLLGGDALVGNCVAIDAALTRRDSDQDFSAADRQLSRLAS